MTSTGMNALNFRVYSPAGRLLAVTRDAGDAAVVVRRYGVNSHVRLGHHKRSVIFTVTDDNYDDAEDWEWVVDQILEGERAFNAEGGAK